MSLSDSFVGGIIGAVVGFVGAIVAQEYSVRRDKTEMTKQRVYGPLYDEISDSMVALQKDDSPSNEEWTWIIRQEHFGYLIEPPELYANLKTFTKLPFEICADRSKIARDIFSGK